MTVLFVGLGVIGSAVLIAAGLILWSSFSLFRTAGVVDIDAKPAYLVDAEKSLAALEMQYGVAEELNQAPGILEELTRRITAARQALENARKAAEQPEVATAPAESNPVLQPVRVRRLHRD